MSQVPHNASKVTVPVRYHDNATESYFEMNCAAHWARSPASQLHTCVHWKAAVGTSHQNWQNPQLLSLVWRIHFSAWPTSAHFYFMVPLSPFCFSAKV